jgi:hypothetical protein
MAQATKSKPNRTKQTKSKPSSSSRKRSNSKPRKRRTQSKPSPVSVVESTAKDAGATAKDAGKAAGKTVGRAASKAKVPLLAGGAALAGAAGGIALGTHQARRHKGLVGKVKPKVKPHDLAKAAKRVGDFGAQMGHFANELQRAREDSNGHSRSPVEVVLQGLTTRRN